MKSHRYTSSPNPSPDVLENVVKLRLIAEVKKYEYKEILPLYF